MKKNEKHIKTIIEKAKASSTLYLATDPDREGEAIAWHIYEILNKKKLFKDKPIYRIAFHEITKKANKQKHSKIVAKYQWIGSMLSKQEVLWTT